MTPAAFDRPAMKAVIEDAYKVFGRYRTPSAPLDACTHCCMSAELERQMRELSLRKLTPLHFYEYNSAAKSEVQPAQEVLYFLPRMLELIAQGEEVHHSLELYLDRVGRCPPGSLEVTERAVLNRFALAYFANHLAVTRAQLLEDPLAVLLMFHIGGLDVQPLLDYWLRCEDPQSTVQYVDASYWHFWEGRKVSNAFAEGRTQFQKQVSDWMLEPANRMNFVDKLVRPEFQKLIELQSDSGRMPFKFLVDAVFDNLIE
jgi:hypothetical protein